MPAESRPGTGLWSHCWIIDDGGFAFVGVAEHSFPLGTQVLEPL